MLLVPIGKNEIGMTSLPMDFDDSNPLAVA